MTASRDSSSNLSNKANRRAHPPKLKIHCTHPWWLTSGCIKRGEKTSKKSIFLTIRGLAEEADNPLGDLFFSLAPTIEEARICGGCYQYQQVVISNLIEEFGFEINILVSLPPPRTVPTQQRRHPFSKGRNNSERRTSTSGRITTPRPLPSSRVRERLPNRQGGAPVPYRPIR